VDGYRAVAIANDYKVANFVAFEGTVHWVGTDRGLYGVTGDEAFRVEGLEETVIALQSLGGELWVRSPKAVYRIDVRKAQAFCPLDPNLNVDRLEEIAGGLWLFTTRLVWSGGSGTTKAGPVYILDEEVVHEAPTRATPICAVSAVRDDLWFVSDEGPAYRLRESALKAFPRKGSVVHAISNVGGAVWLRAQDGAYRVRGERAQRIPNKTLSVFSIEEREGLVLVITDDEAYQVDGDKVTQIPRPSSETIPPT